MAAWLSHPKRISIAFSCAFTVALSLWGSPAWAGDPFRKVEPHNISDNTEAAFEAMFKKGNYSEAKRHLAATKSSEADEPLAYAMLASLAYAEKDWETFSTYASQTVDAAQQLKSQDPLRGNLYLAVGNLLKGAYTYKIEGPVRVTSKLRKVFYYFDQAENEAPNDPELNLLRAYLDLLLAGNIPFSRPNQAIKSFKEDTAPAYLANRGIAIAYRDMEQYDKALRFVDKAIEATPKNPELHYLKGQILYQKGKENDNPSTVKQAVEQFDQALAQAEQLPSSIVDPIERERRIAQKLLAEMG
ncbi:MAG: hypothetical protein BRC40_12890 [Cyanobacteria bacterium QH_8_48_120]|nr:MAG: hypothetical protein BRC40_12890 [Cyanobacteria bacterium QH_8_48_120]